MYYTDGFRDSIVHEYEDKHQKVVCYNCGGNLTVRVENGYIVYKCNFCGAKVRREIAE